MIIKKYFLNLKLSISSIDYYLEIIEKPLRTSFFFFIITMVLIGLFRGVDSALTELPKFKNDVYMAMNELDENFDADLEIIWADDQLELNRNHVDVNWPSMIDYQENQLPSALAIISNSETPPQESELLSNKSSLAYINKNNIYFLSEVEGEEWTEYPLDMMFGDLRSYSLNKQNLPKIILEIKDIIDRSFSKIQIAQAIALTFVFTSSKIWFLFAESILVYFLFKIYRFDFSFKKVLKLNLNIMVPTEIIHLFSDTLYGDLLFPINSIAFWVILIFVSFQLRKIRNKKLN